tara:strand:+ start:127 stop:561 length:435 start_codon:yes stop_codon:yes gene_type:complete
MAVEKGDFVRVHYTGYVGSKEFDRSEEPFCFRIGQEGIIKGFQEAVLGMQEGEKKKISIAKDDAYGERDDKLLTEIPLTQLGDLPNSVTLQPGVAFQLKDKLNNSCIVTVKELKEESVVLDLNHPLAGKALEFELELLECTKQS